MDRQYDGIDFHRRRSVIVGLSAAGEKRSSVRVANDRLAIAAAVAEAGPDLEVVVEASYGWYWVVDLLEANGAESTSLTPRGLNWGQRRVKNDERDAIDLADMLRLGRLPEAWIAPPATRELRELVRYRAKLVALRSGLKAQVHAVMAKEGVLPAAADLFCVAGMAMADNYTTRVESLRDLIELYDREVAMLEGEIHIQLRHHRGYHAIQAINGVGRTIAAILVAEIGHAGRFRSAEALCSWAGLTPRHRQSDIKTTRGSITKQGSKLVRWALIEAVSRYHGGPKLAGDFRRIAERRGNNKARVAVARKVLTLDSHCRCCRGDPTDGTIMALTGVAERLAVTLVPLGLRVGGRLCDLDAMRLPTARRTGWVNPSANLDGESGARNRDGVRRPMRCVDVPLTADGADGQFGAGTLVSVRVRARQGVAVPDLRDRLSWSRDKSRDRTRTGHLRSLVRRPRTEIVP
jgi:transposase